LLQALAEKTETRPDFQNSAALEFPREKTIDQNVETALGVVCRQRGSEAFTQALVGVLLLGGNSQNETSITQDAVSYLFILTFSTVVR